MRFLVKSEEIEVGVADWSTLEAEIVTRFSSGEGFALATLNLDHLVKLASDQQFCRAYQTQDLVVADGNPIVWMSRLARQEVTLLPGADMVLDLARLAQKSGVSVGLVGSTEESLRKAGEILCQKIAGLKIATAIAPPFGFDPMGEVAASILEQLEASGARMCFLALGAPKQEIFAARGRELAPSIGFASIGAGLDFLAGSQQRAPEWVRKLALEWLWRMVLQPGRMVMRYLHCFRILPGHMIRSLKMRFKG